MKILLVEDEVQMSEAIASLLKKNQCLVECAYDGEEGYRMGLVGDYDVIIMDIMMPVMDGYTAVKKLRAADIKTPIIMLTALASVEDKVKGLDIGADDYMTKPFSMDELTARLRAITRRRRGDSVGNELKVGNTTLNIKEYKLSCGGKSIALSGKEYELALCFFSNPGCRAKSTSWRCAFSPIRARCTQRTNSSTRRGGSIVISNPTISRYICRFCARSWAFWAVTSC